MRFSWQKSGYSCLHTAIRLTLIFCTIHLNVSAQWHFIMMWRRLQKLQWPYLRCFVLQLKQKILLPFSRRLNISRSMRPIIEYRFMDHISVEIDVDEDVLQNTIIKLILQPIVENAVFHGLEQKMGDGEVTVIIRRKLENYIMLLVKDNGCGMDEKKVQQLTQSLENNSTKSKGIGLANIYQRLKLFYGDDIVFEIKSKPGEGTRVMIVLPDHVEER